MQRDWLLTGTVSREFCLLDDRITQAGADNHEVKVPGFLFCGSCSINCFSLGLCTYMEIRASLSTYGFKGSVQRKLRWVENGVNRSVGASDCGAGRSFVILFGFHLGFAIFPFPVSTAQIIGEL
jgi:hypothetical protein